MYKFIFTIIFALSALAASAQAPPIHAPKPPGMGGLNGGAVIFVDPKIMEQMLMTRTAIELPENLKNFEGIFTIDILIDESGRVISAKGMDGDASVRPYVTQAILQWIYQPYLLNGRPVKVQTKVFVTMTKP